ncbi:hypothetical protein [Massilia consociata]|uniref:Uncharacterized protein n=1 Tax=Massilia consociata TaxID=760117 RepID=A0ABV6FAY8_9BURK
MEAPTAVKRYNLSPPGEQDVLASLTRLVGPDESSRLWTSACRQAGARSGAILSLEQFEKVLLQLKQSAGLAAVAASSILVRLKSYRTLSLMNAK